MVEATDKDELLRTLLYESSFTGAVCVGLNGDAEIDGLMTDELEDEVRGILNE